MTTTTKGKGTTTTTLTVEGATTLTSEIRLAGKNLATARTKFSSLVTKARKGDAATVLGFKSWPEYVATVFADMPGLNKSDSEYLAGFMAGEGMSSRAVARVLGVSQSTAARMIRQGEESGKVDPSRKVTGTDGKGQRKGKGKGQRKARPAAGKGKGKGQPASKGQRLTDMTSEELGVIVTSAVKILSERWRKGDESAESALVDLFATLDSHGISG